jgi:MHS family alpha-ketoglutarate permease-like MFS transporter
MTTLSHTTDQFTIFLLMMAALLIVSGYTSINAVVKAELFPAGIRALGVGFPYSVTVALFGGTAEYFALWFKNGGNEAGYYWYTSGCIFISLLVYVFMKDTKKNSLIERGV